MPLLLPIDLGVFLLPLTNLKESLLLSVELLSILVKKKLYYKMVFVKETELKKKINGDIEEQNIVMEK